MSSGLSVRSEKARGLRDRLPAGEAFADVNRGLSVDGLLALEQRNVVGRAERDDGVRVERFQRCTCHWGLGRADDRDLLRRREVEVECVQRPGELRGAAT